MSDSQWRHFATVVKRALRMPLSVSLLSVGILFALVMHDFTGLLILAGAAAGTTAYVARLFGNEAFIRGAIREEREQQQKADALTRTFRIEELDVESRVRMKSIVKLQGQIAEDVAKSPVDEVAIGLADTVEKTGSIVERGLAMAQKRRDLQRYVGKTDKGAIQSRIHSIEGKLQSETDPIRRSELESSIAAKRQELEDYIAIEQAAARVLDQLDSIECSFSSLRARLVRIQSTDIAEWAAANEELQTELGGISTAVDAVEQSIEEVLSVGHSA